MWFLRSYKPVTLALLLSLLSAQPALAFGNLTLPFDIPDPVITSWMDHHYPTRQADGIMIRFDGATGYAYDGHRGTDYAVPSNTPVVAADDGTVIYAEWSNDGGWGVVIDHATDRTAYFHNNKLFVYEGQHVSRGQLIALSGSTGNSTGPHVHFEVRDLQTPWHSIDPYGWIGKGPDPWNYDQGYLWTSNPPVPFLLPLAFFGGARWDYWYGRDGPPPPVSWQLRSGQYGLAGWAAKWDADPGLSAARSYAIAGSSAVPGTGSHTLHLRVWDRAGRTADISYLYLYDTDPPTSSLTVDRSAGGGVVLHWSGQDSLSGVGNVSIDVAAGNAGFRPWVAESMDQPSAGIKQGGLRFLGRPGQTYQFRLNLTDAARNAAPSVLASASIPVSTGPLPSASDQAILGALPAQPDGSAPSGGLRQEHPDDAGGIVLSADASLQGTGADRTIAGQPPASTAAAVDMATSSGSTVILLADGTSWYLNGAPGPRFSLRNPVRLLSATSGALIAVGADGSIGNARPSQALPSGVTVVDAALFPGTGSGLILDSTGMLRPFGGADAAMTAVPGSWTLPQPPEAIALAGSAQAPAGILTDSSGDWQTFGSLLLLPESIFGRPVFDPMLGLAVR